MLTCTPRIGGAVRYREVPPTEYVVRHGLLTGKSAKLLAISFNALGSQIKIFVI
jgi:hypothetical protein